MEKLDNYEISNIKGGGCLEGAAGGFLLTLNSGGGIFGPWALVDGAAIGCLVGVIAD